MDIVSDDEVFVRVWTSAEGWDQEASLRVFVS